MLTTTSINFMEAGVVPVGTSAFKAAETQKWVWWVRLPHVSAI